MVRAAGFLTLILLASPQDPADKIKALIMRLESDEISVRTEAERELVKLGPGALPALREHLAKGEGERKARLKGVLSKIERVERLAKVLEPAPRVTVKAAGRRAAEVFAEIEKQAGMRIDTSELPPDTTITTDLAGVTIWDALDAICKAHGKIMFAFSPNRIVIERAAYRALPRAASDAWFAYLDHFFVTYYGTADKPRFCMRPGLAWPPGRAPAAYRLETDSLVDDVGTTYTSGAGLVWVNGSVMAGGSGATIFHMCTEIVPDKARTIAEWKGRLVLYVPTALVKDASIEKPLGKWQVTEEGDESRITLHSSRRNANRIHLELTASLAADKAPTPGQYEIRAPSLVHLRDSTGKLYGGEADITPQRGGVQRGADWVTYPISMEFEVPEKVEIESLDFMVPQELHEVAIPFAFQDLRFRTWK